MDRKYLYWGMAIASYFVSVWIIAVYFTHDIAGGLLCAIPCLMFGLLIGRAVDRWVSSAYPDALYTSYKDMRSLAQARQKKREELQETMLYKMQYMHGLERTIAELNEIFTANRSLKLTRWRVFRAWYKSQIDHMLQHPSIYGLTVQGEPYCKDDDPLYDPNAPDWSIYDSEHYYDDDDDDYDCDYEEGDGDCDDDDGDYDEEEDYGDDDYAYGYDGDDDDADGFDDFGANTARCDTSDALFIGDDLTDGSAFTSEVGSCGSGN